MNERWSQRLSYHLLIQAIRVGLYSLVILLTVFNHLLQENYFNWDLMRSFYGLAAIGLLIHLPSLIWLDRFFAHRNWVFFTFICDIFLISALMGSSGLNPTLFLFMYLVTIILAGLVFQLRGSLLIAVFASIGFTVSSWFGPEVKAMSFLFILVLNNISFFTVAGLSGYLADQLNLFEEKIQVQNLSLRVIRKLNEMIIETIPTALLTINSQSEILQFNSGAIRIFSREDLAALRLFDLLPELFKKSLILSELRKPFRTEVKHSSPTPGTETARLLGIQILPQESDFEVATFLVMIEDLTQIREKELAIRQSEKMAAIGGLAAGIAHEIRNPLAGISGSIELLTQNFDSDDDKKLGRIILREIDRLNRLVSEFLDFAKPEKIPSEKIRLDEIVKSVVDNARLSLPVEQQKNLILEMNLQEKTFIDGDSDKLKQAFLNIIINALQAMGGMEKPHLKVSLSNNPEGVILRIKDSGIGMKPETKKRMFEPFHTTKAKGTGLGLAITHKILESHGAHIFVESEEKLGTEFVISFPLKSIEN